MPNTPITTILAQLDKLIADYEAMMAKSENLDRSDIPDMHAAQFSSAGLAIIQRIVGETNSYYSQTKRDIDSIKSYYIQGRVPIVGGALKALRNDVANGYLVRIEELIHTDMFSDFLDMAEYFLEAGYKDPAAVMIGGVLEEHLRKLSLKNGVDITIPGNKGQQPKKADSMNADLYKAGVYSALDQKAITSWLDLRNKAAHGEYSEYNLEQVKGMLSGVAEFIRRIPA